MRYLIIFLFTFLFADINQVLYKITVKNDLSNKTKKENSGILYVLTREDINSLQITHLRDVFNILPIHYLFNRYGIIDPLNPNTNLPFLSSTIKVFIDNQEIVSGFYNSGLAFLGDLDLGWVDHIEVYTQAPSLDISTEPSIVVIKLYSKKASRDEGNNIHISKGNKNSLIYFEKAKEAKYSYYTYISGNIEKSHYNNSKNRKQFLLNIYNDKSSLLIQSVFVRKDGFLGFSLDGKVNDSFIKNKFLHIGYIRKIGDFDLYTGLSITKNKTYYYETPILFIYKKTPIQKVNIHSYDRVIDINLKYKKEINKYIILMGVKNRFKYFNWTTLKFNDINLPQTDRNSQNIHTAFFQLSKFLNNHSLINFGYAYSYYINKDIKNQKTNQLRIAHTYLKNKFTFKTVFSHIEYTMDPYLINSIFVSKNILNPVKIDNFFENIKFNEFLYSFDFSAGYFISKNYLMPNKQGLLYNYDKRMKDYYTAFRYAYRYAPFSKCSFNYYFQLIKNSPISDIYRDYKIALYNYNQYKKLTPFEELIINKIEGGKFYYNLNLGASYQKNDNLSFFVKGENLLNKGEKYNFFSLNPITGKFNQPISVPLIERKVEAGMEYSF